MTTNDSYYFMRNNKPVDFLQQEKKIEQDNNKWKRYIFLALASVSVIAVITGISFSALPSSASDTPKDIKDTSLKPQQPKDFIKQIGSVVGGEKKQTFKNKERINVLLLGMGGKGHDGPYLTDTIIIGSIKPNTGEVAMVSIPRDLRVKIPDLGYRKINYVNAYGESQKDNWGAAYTTKVVENKFDIDINYYARVDFKAFKDLVNEMDGIEINIEQGFVDNQYPAQNDTYQTVKFEEGIQTMNGERALKYARSRHGTNDQNSDFSRARRQQKVILAAKRKALSYNTLTDPKKIYNIMKSMESDITTNMRLSDIVSMIDLAEKLKINDIKTLVLDSSKDGLLTSKVINDTFFLVPKSGNFDKINQKMKNVFNLNKEDLVKTSSTAHLSPKKMKKKNINIEIKNGTWRAGLAARTKTELKKFSFSVNNIDNTKEKPIKTSGIYKINKQIERGPLKKMKDELNIPIKEQLRPGIDISTSTDVTIILGKDYQK